MATGADFDRGWQMQQAGELRQAEAIYRDLLQTEPDNARVWFVLGTLCQADRRLAEAVDCFRRALRLRPSEAEGHFYLGNACLEHRQLAEAAAAYQDCLRLKPDHAEALTNLGFIYGEQGNPDEALARYRRALELKPHYPELHHNLGNVLRQQGKLTEALAAYRRALQLRPDYWKAHVNLAIALLHLGELDEAVDHLGHAARLQPDHAEVCNGLGAAVSMQGRLEEAAAYYRRAVALDPNYAEAHWNLALVELLRGDFRAGWAEYEWRWKCREVRPLPAVDRPRWDGSPLDGKPVLLVAEQGLGDTLQFVRYAPLVRQRGGTVLVRCQKSLTRILARSPGIDVLVPDDAALPECAAYIPLLSLPGVFATELATIPAAVPYVFAEPELVEHWRRQLAPLRGFRVGIAWQGNPKHPWDRHRSIPLEQFAPLAQVPGVQLVALQKGFGAEQLHAAGLPLVAFGSQLDEAAGPFMDTAAILRNLDLVIAADSAFAHLAGAMGVPVWVALCATPDWRWLQGRADSPWYPTMRLFRQTRLGDWPGVFAEMAAALRQHVAERPAVRPITIAVSGGELLDRIAELEVRREHCDDPAERARLDAEVAGLQETCAGQLATSAELEELRAQLHAAHAALAQTQDDLAGCERDDDFGPHYMELSGQLRRLTAQRAELLSIINEILRPPPRPAEN